MNEDCNSRKAASNTKLVSSLLKLLYPVAVKNQVPGREPGDALHREKAGSGDHARAGLICMSLILETISVVLGRLSS